jgi:hypothetical protein
LAEIRKILVDILPKRGQKSNIPMRCKAKLDGSFRAATTKIAESAASDELLSWGAAMSQPRAADDFAVIRANMGLIRRRENRDPDIEPSPAAAPTRAWFEGEVETRGGVLRVRGRLCRDAFVIAAFKRDYPLGQASESILDEMVTALERQQPGETDWLRARGMVHKRGTRLEMRLA